MLNELETLSQNIGRLISLNKRYHSERLALEEQVAQLRADATLSARNSRNCAMNAMHLRPSVTRCRQRSTTPGETERDSRKAAALENAEQADNQLDLLDAQARTDGDDAASHGEHA